MADNIRIQMMDYFLICIDDQRMDSLASKSRKGAALVQYLILNEGKPVPIQQLLAALWDEEKSTNPENALKTLVSRLRVLLNQIHPVLGSCVVSDRGAYHWQCADGMTVDMYEIEAIFSRLSEQNIPASEQLGLCSRLMEKYRGDLLQHSGRRAWAQEKAAVLHNKYIAAVYRYIELLQTKAQHTDIVSICRRALDVDPFDDRLHMELMAALVRTNRTGEALVQYKHAVQLNYRYLGSQPSEEMKEFYRRVISDGRNLDNSLESIRSELLESSYSQDALVCEYAVFKEIFSLQMRNLERLGTTMFLAILTISPCHGQEIDPIRQNRIMEDLLEILRENLRRGDTITRFAPNVFALLLPMAYYSSGSTVLERIRQVFYRKFPNSDITLEYRLGSLDSGSGSGEEP